MFADIFKYTFILLLLKYNFKYFCVRVFGTSMVEEYEEIAESQYNTERLEYLDEDYGMDILVVFSL